MKITKKVLAFVLCLAMFVTCVNVDLYNSRAVAVTDKVIITVNYVYKENNEQVAQSFKAQLEKGTEFKETVEVPTLLSHNCPSDEVVGLKSGISLVKNTSTQKYQLTFNLDSVSEDITVTVYYVAGTAKYKVYHYYQNIDNDDYTLGDEEIELTGNIGAYIEATEHAKYGFKCVRHDQSFITADGSAVVNMYYDRLNYTVVFDVNGGINGPEPLYKRYESTFDISDITEPTRKGYDFEGWRLKDTDSAAIKKGTVTVTGDAIYVAQWKAQKSNADYTIIIWGQNADDDDYSYINSYEAWGNVGNDKVTWNENTLISHTHGEECSTTCSKVVHTHNEECGLSCKIEIHTHTSACCSLAEHIHVMSCYTGVGSEVQELSLYTTGLFWYYKQECRIVAIGGNKYICINNTWYEYTGSQSGTATPSCGKTAHTHGVGCNTEKCGNQEVHTHTAECYQNCGLEEHTHQNGVCNGLICEIDTTPKTMGSLKLDSTLWIYEKSDTVTVKADGTTVLNVYFKRTEFTLTFNNNNKGSDRNKLYGSIKARWGKNISSQYKEYKDISNSWSNKMDGSGPWTNYIAIMPAKDITYYKANRGTGKNGTMIYYQADLTGDYKRVFELELTYSGSHTVTIEDCYAFDGFTFVNGKIDDITNFTLDSFSSASNGLSNGLSYESKAEFYYKRNTYDLVFWSGDTIVYNNTVPYETPLSNYSSTEPTSDQKPVGYEDGAVFVGWYQNPECTGEAYDFGHTMPSHNVVLYAKWQNIPYTVTTYTDSTCTTKFTYTGYNGSQSVEKYTLAEELEQDPIKNDEAFIGWFYDDNGTEKPFSFTMPITKDYNLYPKFETSTRISYVVHYYILGTATKLAQDKKGSGLTGSNIAEMALEGSKLTTNTDGKTYYPTEHSKSIILSSTVNEIIFYYTEATYVGYKVRYIDEKGNEIYESKTVSNADTKYDIVTEDAISVEKYILVSDKTQRLILTSDESKNVITFIYKHVPEPLTVKKDGVDTEKDPNAVFMFRVEGVDDDTNGIDIIVTVKGNGQVTIKDLPLGKYKITEIDSWSWRYEPTQKEQTVTLGDGGMTVTFTNKRTNDKWLDDETSVDNIYGESKITQTFNPAKAEGK